MSKKYKITFAIHGNLQTELREKMIKEGYGLRGKSAWISQAIEQLLEYKNFQNLVTYSDEMCGFDKMETIVIDFSLKIKLDTAITTVRKHYPNIEGVKSSIIRTAILQRILRT